MVGEGDPLGQPPMSPQAGGIPQHLSDHAQSMEDHRMGSYASPYQRYLFTTLLLIFSNKIIP